MKAPRRGQDTDWFTFRNISDDEAEIDIYGQIGGFSWWDDDETVTAQSFRKKLKEFKNKSHITVHINSPGGSVFEALAIYNALKQHDAEIKVVIDALAASAASFVAMAADEGQLIMARNAVMMIHDASGVAMGDAAIMREMADLLDKHSDNIADIYAQRTGEDAVFWRTAMVEETWYTGTEAVTAGLADSVLEDENEEAEQAAASFDLSIYNYAGREQAPAPSVIHKRIKAQMNQAKENAVSGPTKTPKAHGDGTGTPPAEGENPPVEEEQTPVQETAPAEETGADGNGEPTTGTQPPPAEETEPENRAGGPITMLINGVQTSDPRKIQAHITALETAQTEAKEQGRKDFVASLVKSNKLAAPQATATETFALGLNDDQFAQWQQTWDSAPANALFASHGEGSTNHGGAGSTPANDREAEIEKLEAIVAYHRQAGKTQAQIENMKSWHELQQLKPSSESKS